MLGCWKLPDIFNHPPRGYASTALLGILDSSYDDTLSKDYSVIQQQQQQQQQQREHWRATHLQLSRRVGFFRVLAASGLGLLLLLLLLPRSQNSSSVVNEETVSLAAKGPGSCSASGPRMDCGAP